MSACRAAAIAVLVTSIAAVGQSPTAGPRFDAASIRLATLSAAGPVRGARRRANPSRVELLGTTLPQLIRAAHRLEAYQEVTGPEWIRRRYFDVIATLPEGATRDQIPEMLQALLADQLKLVMRRENREQPVCLLSVGKNGPKLKEVPADATPEPVITHSDGRMLVVRMNTPHGYLTYSRLNGTVILEAPKITLPELANTLGKEVKMPVLDRTGLQGFYEVSLFVPGASLRSAHAVSQGEDGFGLDSALIPGIPLALEPEGVSIFKSIERIGLKLEKRKVPLEHFIVESAEQNPSDR
jgi:uncharacterized protein (TIGR03435 family)